MTQNLLEPLTPTLETVRHRLTQHQQVLSENKTRTRRSLIEPVLGTLGWDTENPDNVIHEYRDG